MKETKTSVHTLTKNQNSQDIPLQTGDSLTNAKDKINKAASAVADLRIFLLKHIHEDQEKKGYDIELLLYQSLDDLDKISQQKQAEAVGCEKCGGRLALIKGYFYYRPDEEPYESGIEEDAEIDDGECWVGGFKCDKCDHIQRLWHE